jgi:hypothetical protein
MNVEERPFRAAKRLAESGLQPPWSFFWNSETKSPGASQGFLRKNFSRLNPLLPKIPLQHQA